MAATPAAKTASDDGGCERLRPTSGSWRPADKGLVWRLFSGIDTRLRQGWKGSSRSAPALLHRRSGTAEKGGGVGKGGGGRGREARTGRSGREVDGERRREVEWGVGKGPLPTH